MKRFIFWLVLVLTMIPGMLFAQKDKTKTIVEETTNDSVTIITTTVVEKEAFFTNGFWHNWELSVGLGPHAYVGENDYMLLCFEFVCLSFLGCVWGFLSGLS